MSGISKDHVQVAYFSMEVGLESKIPTYSGGLGVLAGDTLRSAADLEVPMVGMTLLHRKGYFKQHLDDNGGQNEAADEWYPEEYMEPQRPRVAVEIEGRRVEIMAFKYVVHGITGHHVPVYFLDTAVEENSEWDQKLTDHLYGGDEHYRLCQEVILGIGGVAMLRELGFGQLVTFHMNEGHSALLTLELLRTQTRGNNIAPVGPGDIDAVRRRCVFTTHTPVPAGHDKYDMDHARRVLGDDKTNFMAASGCCPDGMMNTTYIALFFSHYINGVSHKHEEISQGMFPNYPINSITNGIHAVTWTSSPMRILFDRHIPEWRKDNFYLRYACSIPVEDVAKAHAEGKRALVREIRERSGMDLDPGVFTIGFARRATPYKRADLLFSDLQRLKDMVRSGRRIQVVFAGKAHPRDGMGKDLIRRIFQHGRELSETVPVVYLQGYDMGLGKLLTSGVDLWLNTPQKPQEASGTSGMKAAVNGVPSLSVLDGWWIEGHLEGITGWSIDDCWKGRDGREAESASLYDKLEEEILPMYYDRPGEYSRVRRSAIALNGAFFSAQRMMFQYVTNAYREDDGGGREGPVRDLMPVSPSRESSNGSGEQ